MVAEKTSCVGYVLSRTISDRRRVTVIPGHQLSGWREPGGVLP